MRKSIQFINLKIKEITGGREQQNKNREHTQKKNTANMPARLKGEDQLLIQHSEFIQAVESSIVLGAL